MKLRVRSLASLSGLRIQHCRELWCRPQTWLRSSLAVAVAKAGSSSSSSSPCLESCMCCGCDLSNRRRENSFHTFFKVQWGDAREVSVVKHSLWSRQWSLAEPTDAHHSGYLQMRKLKICSCYYFNSILFYFLGFQVWHMEVPRLGVKLELQLPAYTTATAMPDSSLNCDTTVDP